MDVFLQAWLLRELPKKAFKLSSESRNRISGGGSDVGAAPALPGQVVGRRSVPSSWSCRDLREAQTLWMDP